MPGTGTKTADTKAEPPARCLDLTRLVSRAGKQHSGVDRVEMAYLTHLLAADAPLFGLVRTSLGYLLLDQTGCAAFRNRLARGDIGRPTLFSLLARRSDRARAGAESDLRRDAIGRARTHKLGDMLLRHLPRGASYINVGHTNLSRATVQGLRAVPGMRIAVMIHDTIPLDLPDMQRAGSVARFPAPHPGGPGPDSPISWPSAPSSRARTMHSCSTSGTNWSRRRARRRRTS